MIEYIYKKQEKPSLTISRNGKEIIMNSKLKDLLKIVIKNKN